MMLALWVVLLIVPIPKRTNLLIFFKNSGKLARILPEREMSGTAISISADFVKCLYNWQKEWVASIGASSVESVIDFRYRHLFFCFYLLKLRS